jgi:hypothetical protein
MTSPLYTEIDRLQMENKEFARLIDKAADFIGTDPELRSIACIDVALDHAACIRREFYDNRLKEVNKGLLDELRNIANAKPDTWDDPNEFRAWAQNRARFTIAKAEEKP